MSTGLVVAAIAGVAALTFKNMGGLSTGDYPNWTGVVALIILVLSGATALILICVPAVLALADYLSRKFSLDLSEGSLWIIIFMLVLAVIGSGLIWLLVKIRNFM